MQSLGSSIDAIYDLTLGYVDRGERPSEMSILRGKLPQKIHCHAKLYEAAEVPTSEEGLSKWLTDRFDEKEAALAQFYAQQKSAHLEKALPPPTVGLQLASGQ